MANKKMSVEDKIAQLKALQEVIRHATNVRDEKQSIADECLEMCKNEDESTEEENVYDTSKWQYDAYLDNKRAVDAYDTIIEALNDMV